MNGYKYLPMAALCVLLGHAGAICAGTERGGKLEGSVLLNWSDSEDVSGRNGSSVDIDSVVGAGFDLTYNFDQHLALGFNFIWSRPDYEATFNSDEDGLVSVDHRMDLYTGQFNGTWNLLDGPFTPYVQAGIGWNYADSNVSKGAPVTGCYWDPWWGYVCRRYGRSYNETELAYNFGVGLRFEFGNGMFIKGGVNRLEVDGSDFDPTLTSASIALGWIFY